MQEYLYSHLESVGHNSFLEDVLIILIDKADGSDLNSHLGKEKLFGGMCLKH